MIDPFNPGNQVQTSTGLQSGGVRGSTNTQTGTQFTGVSGTQASLPGQTVLIGDIGGSPNPFWNPSFALFALNASGTYSTANLTVQSQGPVAGASFALALITASTINFLKATLTFLLAGNPVIAVPWAFEQMISNQTPGGGPMVNAPFASFYNQSLDTTTGDAPYPASGKYVIFNQQLAVGVGNYAVKVAKCFTPSFLWDTIELAVPYYNSGTGVYLGLGGVAFSL